MRLLRSVLSAFGLIRRHEQQITAEEGVVSLYRWPVYVACTALAVLASYLFGKEMAWDTLNYHLYAGFSAVNDRFSQDYFAAGPIQSYLNPYVYIPFYALVKSGLPALQIALSLAMVHSVVLWLTYELAVRVIPTGKRRERVTIGIASVALAYGNPILMQQFGTSFADIMTAIPVLGGWVLLVDVVRAPKAARVACAGLLLGAATALKLTNALHAVAGAAVLMMMPGPVSGKIRYGFSYVGGVAISFGVVAAPWAYRLEQMFGNPVFPLMNSVFHSPEFTTAPLFDYRFVPATFGEALWRPFAILNPVPYVYEELRAPEVCYAALALLVVCLCLRWLWKWRARARRRRPLTQLTSVDQALAMRALAALGCGLGVDWIMWLFRSGNGRYFLPMTCVAAVMTVVLVFHLCATRPKLRNYILAVIFGAQAIQLWLGTDYRWNGVPWDGGPWFEVTVPNQLKTQPNLYLTMGVQSNSFIAPYLAPGSGLVNFSGGYALGPEGANGRRVKSLIRRFDPHLRVLVRGARLYGDNEYRQPRRSDVDNALGRFGMHTDTDDCATIAVHRLPPGLEITFQGPARAPVELPQPRDTTYLVSCRIVPGGVDHSMDGASQKVADLVLDRVEDACPALFQPQHMLTEHIGDAWRRSYLNTDAIAWVTRSGWVEFANRLDGDSTINLGRVDSWTRAPPRIICGRRNGRFFARVINAGGG